MSSRNIVKSIQDIMRKDEGVDGDAQRLAQMCWLFFLKIIDDQDKQLQALHGNAYTSPIPQALQWNSWASDEGGKTGKELLKFVNSQLFPGLKNLKAVQQGDSRRLVVKAVFEDAINYMKNGNLIREVVNKINSFDFNNLVERKHFGDIYEQMLNDLQGAGNSGEFYTPRALTSFMVERINPKPSEIIFDPSCGTGGFLTCSIRFIRDKYIKTPKDEAAMQAGLRAVELKQLPHMLCVTNMLLHGIEDVSFVRHDNSLVRKYDSYSDDDQVDVIVTNPPFGASVPNGVEEHFPSHLKSKETADLFLSLIIKLLKKGGRAAVVLPDGSLFGEGVKTRLREHLLQECNLHTIVRLPNSVFRPYASIGTNILFFEKGTPTQSIWFYEHRVPDGQKAYSMTRPIQIEHLQPCVDWWGGLKRSGRKETNAAWKVNIDEVRSRNFNLDFRNPHSVTRDFEDPQTLLKSFNDAEKKATEIRDQLKELLKSALLQ
jgi:type I restriction enzyme M protein